ncbi:MAG TPA: hypothetical protein PKM73_02105 [Verrucomicrobiota bacterium]|nr:hypothetical protein [Verrucomicrobiota bacterium]HNU50345.1 hypothetical protein [Verrucomicrobiota bacterium]
MIACSRPVVPAAAIGLLLLALGSGARGAQPADPAVLSLECLDADAALLRVHEPIRFRLSINREFVRPENRHEARLWLDVTGPSGRMLRFPAFYHQPHRFVSRPEAGRDREWVYPMGPAEWRARFAPLEPGRHRAVARFIGEDGDVLSPAVELDCAPPHGPGGVRVSDRDPRFLERDDGRPFFPIGHNLAFVARGQYLDTTRLDGVLERMAGNGANCARVWVCCEDWALALEARKSAWARSWDWNPPFDFAPGRGAYADPAPCVVLGGTRTNATLSPTHAVALESATRYELTALVQSEKDGTLEIDRGGRPFGAPARSSKARAWERWNHRFTTGTNEWWLGDLTLRATGPGRVWIRQLSLRSADGGPELLGEADPSRPARGLYDQRDSCLLDWLVERAARHGIRLQLCLLTRDHYMGDLSDPASAAYTQAVDDAKNLLQYAVARWGSSPAILGWEYFNEIDPGKPLDRFHRELGAFLARIDPYHRLRTTSAWGPAPAHWVHPDLDVAELHWYLRPAWGPLWRDEVQAVLDRTALLRQHAPHRPALLAEFGLADDRWGRSPHMERDRDGVHFHNSLWASAFAGLSGTALFWWWETLDAMDACRHYRPLARFVDEIPFLAATLQPVTATTPVRQCRVLAWQAANAADGWIVHPDAAWHRQVVEGRPPPRVDDDRLVLTGLEAGDYEIRWFDPWQGEFAGPPSRAQAADRLEVAIRPFTRDIAFRLRRQP